MRNLLLEALPDHRVLQTNSLATVTPACVLIRTIASPGQTIVALESIRDMRRVKMSYPGLLVIAIALFLIAAAAYYSKQGDGATIPIAVIGVIFVVFYFNSRRASVAFLLEKEVLETVPGSLREASAVIRAVRKAVAAQSAATE